MSFRGEHVLEFEAKAYAIVARRASDPESSNWAGKTSLLEAIVFALEGDHRFRTEDEWISIGEKHGEVELTFSDGRRIRRSRERGRRTNLYFFEAGEPEGAAMKEEAQKKIDEAIGLTKEDFFHTCYFQQKHMARFIDADPADRMRVISAWLRLEPLEECERIAKTMAAVREEESKKDEGYLAAIAERESDVAKLATGGASNEPDIAMRAILETRPFLVELREKARGAVATVESMIERNATVMAGRARIGEYEAVVAEGKTLASEVKKKNLPMLRDGHRAAEQAASAKASDFATTTRDLEGKKQLAKGEFDGACPVAGIACPAKDAINADRANGRAIFEKARAAMTAKHGELTSAQEALQRSRAELQAAERMEQRLEALREQAKRLAGVAKAAKEAGEPLDQSALKNELEIARGRLYEAMQAIDRMDDWSKALSDAAKTRETILERRAGYAAELGILREAVTIFGKKGAQRKVAEGALAEIEEGANEVLRDSGADLSVQVRWSREGKGLASSCDSCGHPFASSAKVKHCERCGAPRGPKLESKLDVILSRQSGAAEDLAGAGFQLSASKWLRESRGTSWSTALLDEPFTALDKSLRRSFSTHLSAMLGGRYGFEQAFVVSHTLDTANALPGRIEIVSDGTWSVPRVVS